MKKKYYAPEMEEMNFEAPKLLDGSDCPPVVAGGGSDEVCDGITVSDF
jgi:hypothetical protein